MKCKHTFLVLSIEEKITMHSRPLSSEQTGERVLKHESPEPFLELFFSWNVIRQTDISLEEDSCGRQEDIRLWFPLDGKLRIVRADHIAVKTRDKVLEVTRL